MLALDCGLSIYNNLTDPNLSFDRQITDSIVDVGFSVGSFLLCTKIGALIGTAIPVLVLGTILGAAAGTIVGVGVYFFQQTSIYTDIKVSFNDFITKTLPNAWDNLVSN